MKSKIIPAIIAKNQAEFNNRFDKIKSLSKTIQLDVMDGKFVKNKSLWFALELPRRKKYEVHLMVKNPIEWVKDNSDKANMIIIHAESNNVDKALTLVKSKRKKVGIAINPRTSVKKIQRYLSRVNQVTVLCVNPGKYGAKFQPASLKKVKQLRKLKPKMNIEVDGGLGEKNMKTAKKAGANLFISGSYLQNAKDPKAAYKKLKRLVR